MKFAFKHKWLVLVLLIWGIIFSVPKFRNILHAWYDGSPWIQFTVVPNDFWITQFDLKTTELPMKVNVVNDPAWIIIPKSIDDIDQLIHENPNVPWLIAMRLHATMSKFRNNRVGGELSDADISQHIKSGIPSPEIKHGKINFKPAQLKQALALCQVGEKLEPQNAFFSWMRSYFLLIDQQDEKAWKALDQASHKTYWNNHSIDYQNLYAQSFRKIVNRPLLPFETYSIPAGFGLSSFGAYSKLREMARVISWQGIKLNREGHHDEALRIWSSAYKTFTLAAQGQDAKLDFLVDDAVLDLIKDSASYPDRATLAKQPNLSNVSNRNRNSLVLFAQKNHHPDLAKQLDENWQKNRSLHQQVMAEVLSRDALLYMSYHGLDLTQLSSIFIVSGVVLILLLLGALFIWCITSCLIHFLHLNEVAPQKTFLANLCENLSGMAICSGLISFAGGLFLVYLLTLTQNYDFASGWNIAQFFTSSDKGSIIDRSINYAWGLSVIAMDAHWRIMILLTPLVTGIFYVLYKQIDAPNKIVKHPVLRKSWRIVHFCLLLTAWGTLVMITDYEYSQMVAAGIICIFLAISFGWMLEKSRSFSFTKTFKLLQSIAIGLICANSILILTLLTCQSVVGNHLQPWADNQLRGEMHQYHHVIDEPPVKH